MASSKAGTSTVIPGGFDIQPDKLDEKSAAMVKAAPDAIISGPDQYTRALPEGDLDNTAHRA